MQQYVDLIRDVVENGRIRDDRTGTGAIGSFGRQMRFDLSEGFPMVTVKKSLWKGAFEELRWFLIGSTDVKWLQENGVTFWDEWMGDDGTIGNGYGKQFRSLEYLVPVTPRHYEPEPIVQECKDLPEPDFSSDTGATRFRVGSYFSTESGEAVILKELPADEEHPRIHWLIGFFSTGHVRKAEYRSVLDSKVKDPWFRSVHGVGFYGDYDKKDPHYKLLVNVWRDMMARCYDDRNCSFGGYGGSGVHVCSRWHNFANFQEDAKRLDGWNLKKEYPKEYSIDKDMLTAGNRYSPVDCVWSCKAMQDANKSNTHPFTAVSPDGVETIFRTIGQASRGHGLNGSAVHRCLHGKLKTHKGWSEFNYLGAPDGQVLRYQRVDQLKQVIAGIKHDPYSRRHVISLWNPLDLPRTTLPPCHGSVIQFYVQGGKLSCQMYQRSCDLFLGLPVNITVYSLLTILIAHHVGLEPGEYIHTIGDAHIYLNHRDQVDEMLSRSPLGLPKLTLLHSKDKPLDEVVFEDLKLEGYEHHPAIKAPVAV